MIYLGRVKGKHLKKAADELLAIGKESFSQNFSETNQKLKDLGVMSSSKKERNKIAGRIAHKRRIQIRKEQQASTT